MRRVPRLVAVALVVPVLWAPSFQIAALASGQATPPRATAGPNAVKGTAVLRGTVVAADTGAPIRRAQVRASTQDGLDSGVAVTDDQGRFEVRELAGGRYTISASRSGYLNLQYGQRRPTERGTPVELAAGQIVEKLNLALPRGGVIAGHVMDDLGEPLAEVQVQVLRSTFAPGGRRLIPAGRSDTTDDQGAFRIYGLNPGDYMVSATFRSQMYSMGPNGRPGPTVEQGYAPTYYPGTPSVTDAQRIIVGVGQEVSGVAFGLTPTRVARVSGRVVGGGDKYRNGFVSMMLDDGVSVFSGMSLGGQVQDDGTFEITGVAPGRYTVRAQPRAPLNDDTLVGQTTVTVAGADLAGVMVTLRPPSTITGVFEFDGPVPADLRASQLRAMPVPADPSGRFSMTGPPETKDDFTFTVRGMTTPAFLRAGAPVGWTLQSVIVDGQDVTDVPLPLGPGVDIRGVRVRLTQKVSSVSGSVRDDRGQLVLDATVLVFPTDESKWTVASRFMRTARPDTAGRFEVRTLPPSADYRIIALQGVEDGQIYDPDFLSSLRDRSERLSLNEGETKTMDLRLRQ